MKTITKSQFHQIVGILVLAKSYSEKQRDLSTVLAELVDERDSSGELNDAGHCMDAIYCDYDAKTLLKKLKIKVK